MKLTVKDCLELNAFAGAEGLAYEIGGLGRGCGDGDVVDGRDGVPLGLVLRRNVDDGILGVILSQKIFLTHANPPQVTT